MKSLCMLLIALQFTPSECFQYVCHFCGVYSAKSAMHGALMWVLMSVKGGETVKPHKPCFNHKTPQILEYPYSVCKQRVDMEITGSTALFYHQLSQGDNPAHKNAPCFVGNYDFWRC